MPKFQWLDDEQLIQNRMLENAEKPVQSLFEQMCTTGGDISLLRFLDDHANTLMTIEDIAYFVHQPCEVVKKNLNKLVDLGVARCTDVVGLHFLGLTVDPKQQKVVHDLCTLQDIWNARVARMEEVINGRAAQTASPSA